MVREGIWVEDKCMDIVEQKKAAEQFVNDWSGRGDENRTPKTIGISCLEPYMG